MTGGVRASTRRLSSPLRGATLHGSADGAAAGRDAGAGSCCRAAFPPPQPATASATSTTAAPRIARPYCARRQDAVIMPAPTVSFVASSMRMNEPVKRLRA